MNLSNVNCFIQLDLIKTRDSNEAVFKSNSGNAFLLKNYYDHCIYNLQA